MAHVKMLDTATYSNWSVGKEFACEVHTPQRAAGDSDNRLGLPCSSWKLGVEEATCHKASRNTRPSYYSVQCDGGALKAVRVLEHGDQLDQNIRLFADPMMT